MHNEKPYHPRWQVYSSLAAGGIAGSVGLIYLLDKVGFLPYKISNLLHSPLTPPQGRMVDNSFSNLSSKFPQLKQNEPDTGYSTLTGEDYAKMLAGRKDMFFQHTLIEEAKQVEYNGFFANKDEETLLSIVTFGDRVCGHQGIVHGGLLAAAFDEFFGAMIITLRNPGIFTASLTIDYRKPVPADSTYIWRGYIDKVEEEKRKIWVKATLEDEKGTVYTEGRALFLWSRNATKFNAVLKPLKESAQK